MPPNFQHHCTKDSNSKAERVVLTIKGLFFKKKQLISRTNSI